VRRQPSSLPTSDEIHDYLSHVSIVDRGDRREAVVSFALMQSVVLGSGHGRG